MIVTMGTCPKRRYNILGKYSHNFINNLTPSTINIPERQHLDHDNSHFKRSIKIEAYYKMYFEMRLLLETAILLSTLCKVGSWLPTDFFSLQSFLHAYKGLFLPEIKGRFYLKKTDVQSLKEEEKIYILGKTN